MATWREICTSSPTSSSRNPRLDPEPVEGRGEPVEINPVRPDRQPRGDRLGGGKPFGAHRGPFDPEPQGRIAPGPTDAQFTGDAVAEHDGRQVEVDRSVELFNHGCEEFVRGELGDQGVGQVEQQLQPVALAQVALARQVRIKGDRELRGHPLDELPLLPACASLGNEGEGQHPQAVLPRRQRDYEEGSQAAPADWIEQLPPAFFPVHPGDEEGLLMRPDPPCGSGVPGRDPSLETPFADPLIGGQRLHPQGVALRIVEQKR